MSNHNEITDVHLLVAKMHRQALLSMTRAADQHFNGLAMAAGALGLSSSWRRRARDLDAALGLVEKVSEQSIVKYMADLHEELSRASGGKPLSRKLEPRASAQKPLGPSRVDSLAASEAESDNLAVTTCSEAEDGSAAASHIDTCTCECAYVEHLTDIALSPVVNLIGQAASDAATQTEGDMVTLVEAQIMIDKTINEYNGQQKEIEEMMKSLKADTDSLNKRLANSETKAPAIIATPQPVPDCWEAGTDACTGRVYYFRRASGLTQWEMPEELRNDTSKQGKRTARQKDKKKHAKYS